VEARVDYKFRMRKALKGFAHREPQGNPLGVGIQCGHCPPEGEPSIMLDLAEF